MTLENTPSKVFLEKTRFKGVLGSFFPLYVQEATMKYVTIPFILYAIVFLVQISKQRKEALTFKICPRILPYWRTGPILICILVFQSLNYIFCQLDKSTKGS